MKKVEFLYPELCNIYAESYNIEYLSRCCEELEIINTRHGEVPAFARGDVDMIYLGCLTERKQEKVIELLRPYTERIKELIDKGTIFLVTGNAIEIFGKSIEDAGRIIPALGIFDFDTWTLRDITRSMSECLGMETARRFFCSDTGASSRSHTAISRRQSSLTLRSESE